MIEMELKDFASGTPIYDEGDGFLVHVHHFEGTALGTKVLRYKNVHGHWEHHSVNDIPSYQSQCVLSPEGITLSVWRQHGQLHRVAGPAMVWSDGREKYALDGAHMSKERWLREKDDCPTPQPKKLEKPKRHYYPN